MVITIIILQVRKLRHKRLNNSYIVCKDLIIFCLPKWWACIWYLCSLYHWGQDGSLFFQVHSCLFHSDRITARHMAGQLSTLSSLLVVRCGPHDEAHKENAGTVDGYHFYSCFLFLQSDPVSTMQRMDAKATVDSRRWGKKSESPDNQVE